MGFINKLNYNTNGNLVSDEEITLSGGNKVISLLHHNLMTTPSQIEIWTGVGKTGTQITDFTTASNSSKSWVTDVTFGSSVTDRTYYATYYSQGDENDADDINNLQNAIITQPVERQIARYVHSGNLTVQALSVDLATGVFTTTSPQTWTAGTIYKDIVISYVGGIPSKLFSEWNGSNTYGLQVIDANSFYILSGNTTIVTYGSTESIDLTKLQFEYQLAKPPTIDLSTVKVGDMIRTTWSGVRNRPSWTSVQLNWSYSGGTSYYYANALDGKTFEIGYFEQCFKYIREMGMLYAWGSKTISQQWNGGTSWSLSSGIDAERMFGIYPDLQFTSVSLGSGFSNGTVVEVYTTY